MATLDLVMIVSEGCGKRVFVTGDGVLDAGTVGYVN